MLRELRFTGVYPEKGRGSPSAIVAGASDAEE
jgi:hypothetical protein